MKSFFRKYAFAIIPLFLLLLVFCFRPTALKAQDCTDPDTGDPISCGGGGTVTPAPTVTPAVTSGTSGSSGASQGCTDQETGASTNCTSSGVNNPTAVPQSSGADNAGGGTANGTSANAGGGTATDNGNVSGGGTTAGSSGSFYLQNPLCQPGSAISCTVGGIVGGFIQIFAYLVVLFAVLMIIYVGLRLVLAQGNVEEIKTRKEQLLWLVIGVAIVIGARIIVQVVITTLQSAGVVNQNVITNAQNAANLQ